MRKSSCLGDALEVVEFTGGNQEESGKVAVKQETPLPCACLLESFILSTHLLSHYFTTLASLVTCEKVTKRFFKKITIYEDLERFNTGLNLL